MFGRTDGELDDHDVILPSLYHVHPDRQLLVPGRRWIPVVVADDDLLSLIQESDPLLVGAVRVHQPELGPQPLPVITNGFGAVRLAGHE